jgi:hypothetical protein
VVQLAVGKPELFTSGNIAEFSGFVAMPAILNASPTSDDSVVVHQ